MKKIQVETKDVLSFVSQAQIDALTNEAQNGLAKLLDGSGLGSDFLGWVNLPSEITEETLDDINATAAHLRETCDVVVVIGIGGSYLGSKAVIDAISNPFITSNVVFAGHNMGEDYIYDLCEFLKDKKFGIIVISKSGTTTESAIAFRILLEQLEQQMGHEEARKRIVAITDAERGALRTFATTEGYKTYAIPDNVGGRFSVLTPVGLLPIAVAGIDIKKLVEGARFMQETTLSGESTDSIRYAMTRNAIYRAGKKIEILVNYDPRFHFFSEWWKQLYGESEGKGGKGIFPAAVDFSTDLHSMGQWIQDGERSIFETVIYIENVDQELRIPFDKDNLDELNYIAGKRVNEVNRMAELGTRLAHVDGGVPVIRISLPDLSPASMGQLIYFFEIGCGISGYILGVNPFDQPGVEAYKKNRFALLGKPGYEAESEAIKARL